MARRISHRNVGCIFNLRFTGNGSEEEHMLIYFNGNPLDLENCTATFREATVDGSGDEWDAYRHKGRWVYGSSADILVSV